MPRFSYTAAMRKVGIAARRKVLMAPRMGATSSDNVQRGDRLDLGPVKCITVANIPHAKKTMVEAAPVSSMTLTHISDTVLKVAI